MVVKKRVVLLFSLLVISSLISLVSANNYTGDIYFTIPDGIYTINERIELKGFIYQGNYTNNWSLVSAPSGLASANVNLTILYSNKSVLSNYTLTTDANGTFSTKSNYYTTSTEINISTAGDYYIRAEYLDPNNITWYSEVGIEVINQTTDTLKVNSEKSRYYASETVGVEIEAIRSIGGRILHITNVSINGSLRNSSKDSLQNFSCTTGTNGKCNVTVTAPSTQGDYILELEEFKAISRFSVIPFSINVYMKDDLGQAYKNIFSYGEQARVEVQVVNTSDSNVFTFSGNIADSAGNVIKAITSTTLNSNNSFTNSFLFDVDSLTFAQGAYSSSVTVTQSGGSSLSSSTLFKVQGWDLSLNKKTANSGFEYEYSIFPNKSMSFELYPSFRSNGSIIPNITATSFTVNLKDDLDNIINSSTDLAWNASCGSEGCYEFTLTSPSNNGKYILSASLSYDGTTQTETKIINVMDSVMSAQSTNQDGNLKELFGTNEYVYISLTAYNSTTSAFNLTTAEIFSINYMNGSQFNYTQVDNFTSVNSTNSAYEWSWNSTLQRIKLLLLILMMYVLFQKIRLELLVVVIIMFGNLKQQILFILN
jgi:hypothetical protein